MVSIVFYASLYGSDRNSTPGYERIFKVKELGRHILVELYGCNSEIINDLEAIRRLLIEGARKTGATIVGEVFHKFSPQGVSGTVVIAESHLAIHTWPELGYCALDLYTCGDEVDPWQGFHFLLRELQAEKYHAREIARGIHDEKEMDDDPELVIRSISTAA